MTTVDTKHLRAPRERPILFSGPMVRAILDGRKTQARRGIRDDWWRCLDPDDPEDRAQALTMCPHGKPGDRLWVRETWYDDNALRQTEPTPAEPDEYIYYRADGEAHAQFEQTDGLPLHWRPSIHMPRWASRITLEVTGVRVERLQAITEADAKAEGVDDACHHEPDEDPREVGYSPGGMGFARDNFRELWDRINAARGYGWSKNPWVWVIEFRRLTP